MENKKIKIGINASFLRKPNTGIGQVTFNFLKKLNELNVEECKFILYLEEELPKGLKLSENFETRVFLPVWKRDDLIRKIWWEKCLLPKRAQKDGCDVFISMYQCPTIMPKSINPHTNSTKNIEINLKDNKNTQNKIGVGVKHLMIVHDIIPKLFPEYLDNSRKKYYWKLTEKAMKNGERIVTVSKRTEKDIIQHLGISPMKITDSYIDVDEIYKNEVGEDKNKKVLRKYRLKPGYILAGGGYEVRKNVEGVIRAYHLLVEQNKSSHFMHELPKLVIYGKLLPQLAPLATDAEKLVKELNLTKQVKLLDLVPQDHMPALFNNATMFVYPSHYEGFGMPVLEAMNIGIPTIISKKSSLPEVGGDAILYCNPDEIGDIAMVMKNVMLNKDLRETLSQRAKERTKQFSWDKFAEKILNIVENL